MQENRYRVLVQVAMALTIAWVGWSLYDANLRDTTPSGRELAAAIRALEDGRHRDALASFDQAYRLDPGNLGALRGKAQALMQIAAGEGLQAVQLRSSGALRRAEELEQEALQHYRQALTLYDQAIEREQARPESELRQRILGVAYANRGILKDRMGDYRGALADYRRAMQLEPEVATGPGLLTRFLRNQAERPPSVSDRADYLAEQLARPEQKRLMRRPQEDARQRAYRID